MPPAQAVALYHLVHAAADHPTQKHLLPHRASEYRRETIHTRVGHPMQARGEG